jgi:hypothetical protein
MGTMIIEILSFVTGAVVGALVARKNPAKVDAAVAEAKVIGDAAKAKIDSLKK